MAALLPLEAANCPGCGGVDARLVYEASDHIYGVDPRPFPICRCTGCALVYLATRPTPEAIASAYPAHYLWRLATPTAPAGARSDARLTAGYFRQFYARRARIAARLLPSGPVRVLDLGCGNGAFLAALAARREGTFLGLDFAPDPAPAGVTLAPADLNRLGPPDDAPYDMVTLWHVLEHLHAPRLALEAAFERLRPGGTLIVATQNFDALSRRCLGPLWPLNDVPRHLCHFTPATLGALVAAAGFERVRAMRFTEYFPALGGHLFARHVTRPDGTLRALRALGLALAFAPLEAIASAGGWGCTFNMIARRP